MGGTDVSGRASAIKFSELVRVFPLKTAASRLRTSQRAPQANLSRKLSELPSLNRFRRESVAPERRSAFREQQEKPVQYQPNKRGILKCQAWNIQKLVPREFAPSLPSKKYKIQYPHIQGEYEIYCPRCDMFFIDKEEYQDHLLIRQFKVKFVEKINAVQETDNLDDMEFHDTRNQSKMHFDTNRKYYNVNELLDEVQDLRDRARHIRKKRTKTRRFEGFGLPFGHEGRMSTRLSKLRMQSVLTNSQASDRRSGMTDFKDQVFLQLEEFKRKFMSEKK